MDQHRHETIADFLAVEREAERFVLLDEMHSFLQHRWPYHTHRASRLGDHVFASAAITTRKQEVGPPIIYWPGMNVED